MPTQERPGRQKGAGLLGVVHDDDASGPQQPCRHLEVEQGELEVTII
jgi:hypothetical protein